MRGYRNDQRLHEKPYNRRWEADALRQNSSKTGVASNDKDVADPLVSECRGVVIEFLGEPVHPNEHVMAFSTHSHSSGLIRTYCALGVGPGRQCPEQSA
eukprot:6173419-Pleurochrysis_carterae.AAC.1